MDSSKSKTLRESRIPRVSRLPVPNGAGKPPVSRMSSTYVLPKRDQPVPTKHQRSIAPIHDEDFENKMDLSQSSLSSTTNGQSQAASQGFGADTRKDQILSPRHRKPRPSLSDRTVETLSRIPPSPSPVRRKSSFFNSESPMVSPIRPKSSLSHIRPLISHEYHPPLPLRYPDHEPSSPEKCFGSSSAKLGIPQSITASRAVNSSVPKNLPLSHPKSSSRADPKLPVIGPSDPILEAAQEDGGVAGETPVSKVRGSKTLTARVSKPRREFEKVLNESKTCARGGITSDGMKKAPTTTGAASSKYNLKRRIQAHASPTAPSEGRTSPKSSAALRETIAKAKAAHRAVSRIHRKLDSHKEESFPEIELGGNNKAAVQQRIGNARSDGRLNIAAMSLKELPVEILTMYDTNTFDMSDGSWAESVDLVKLVAADNEISSLEEEFFPHEESESSGNFKVNHSNIFGGLEFLDLHGNAIPALPVGFTNLHYLTTLNLSRNRLANKSLDFIAQMHSIQELRLSDNLLKGSIDKPLSQLTNLKVLDLSKNAITSMSPEVGRIPMLQTLNLSCNKLSSLPLEVLNSMSLRELFVSQNIIKGSLIPGISGQLTTLKILDASYNALRAITDGHPLTMPCLQMMNVSGNRLNILPDISSALSLTTLLANENQIGAIPSSMILLPQLKNVDLSGNDIHHLDDRIGLMNNLSVLSIANNPLRERRLLNLNTEDLKMELRSRHSQASGAEADDEGNVIDGAPIRENMNAASGICSIQPGGVADMSSLSLQEIKPTDVEPLAETSSVKVLKLQQNQLATISRSIEMLASTLVTLDLSHNNIGGNSYLSHSLRLPQLRTLNLAANTVQSLDPILSGLFAPSLSEINVSRNRLSTLPVLRSHYSSLDSVFAADNRIKHLPVEAVQGLHILDVTGNEIGFLEPKIGLLDHEGLRTLLVGANRFRVPRRDVVEKGTQAILAWLRDRIPNDERSMDESR